MIDGREGNMKRQRTERNITKHLDTTHSQKVEGLSKKWKKKGKK